MYSWLTKTFVFVILLNVSFIYLGRGKGVPTSLEICERRSRSCLCVPIIVTDVGVFWFVQKYYKIYCTTFYRVPYVALCQSPYWELRGLCAGII